MKFQNLPDLGISPCVHAVIIPHARTRTNLVFKYMHLILKVHFMECELPRLTDLSLHECRFLLSARHRPGHHLLMWAYISVSSYSVHDTDLDTTYQCELTQVSALTQCMTQTWTPLTNVSLHKCQLLLSARHRLGHHLLMWAYTSVGSYSMHDTDLDTTYWCELTQVSALTQCTTQSWTPLTNVSLHECRFLLSARHRLGHHLLMWAYTSVSSYSVHDTDLDTTY